MSELKSIGFFAVAVDDTSVDWAVVDVRFSSLFFAFWVEISWKTVIPTPAIINITANIIKAFLERLSLFLLLFILSPIKNGPITFVTGPLP